MTDRLSIVAAIGLSLSVSLLALSSADTGPLACADDRLACRGRAALRIDWPAEIPRHESAFVGFIGAAP